MTENAADRIGLVLSGGGARGAYEAGVLSVLALALKRRGEQLSILVGSAGAIKDPLAVGARLAPASAVTA